MTNKTNTLQSRSLFYIQFYNPGSIKYLYCWHSTLAFIKYPKRQSMTFHYFAVEKDKVSYYAPGYLHSIGCVYTRFNQKSFLVTSSGLNNKSWFYHFCKPFENRKYVFTKSQTFREKWQFWLKFRKALKEKYVS